MEVVYNILKEFTKDLFNTEEVMLGLNELEEREVI